MLLQSAVSDILLTGLEDQAFSIVLLCAFAVWMVKRQSAQRIESKEDLKELQDKFDKYMEDDRERMFNVIEKNTRVMERMEEHLERQDNR